MLSVTFVNNTSAVIHVKVTNDNETSGTSAFFYDIASGKSDTWARHEWQIAYVLRDDTGLTEMFVTKPGNTYQIERISGAGLVAAK